MREGEREREMRCRLAGPESPRGLMGGLSYEGQMFMLGGSLQMADALLEEMAFACGYGHTGQAL